MPHTSPRRTEAPPLPEPLPIPVVDNHTHVDIERDGVVMGGEGAGGGVRGVIEAARAVGVDRLVQIGCELESARVTAEVVTRHPEVLGGVALHPNEVPVLAERGELESALEEIDRLLRGDRIRVVGETGLDYFRTPPEGRAVQAEGFRWHIDRAKELGLALQIHDRDAHEDVLRILAEEGAPDRTVLHCFSGDISMARECVERGYMLSFAGTVTFKNARDLRDALAVVPLENLLVETDAPYLTPHPHRGAPNAPYLVPLTVRTMASTLNVSVPELCQAISENSERVYGPW
ncbi:MULTISPECIES: TatD family hydrolase [Kytococcus]|uniref:TatD family deoxyribonuclease n=1 Tax=Kytococcus schroeteri TaxID=138300 RepID=A0A2I1PB10_9MICO|nr:MULTISPECIES: TatD family hydrolase [Kytococcus]OFS14653.1 AraC family transcriptional regulator [Kytococcus sp. HMSC28H12]PKZ41822.1 TatD family deoxyribonuclease [Kytococcus schroeteri]